MIASRQWCRSQAALDWTSLKEAALRHGFLAQSPRMMPGTGAEWAGRAMFPSLRLHLSSLARLSRPPRPRPAMALHENFFGRGFLNRASWKVRVGGLTVLSCWVALRLADVSYRLPRRASLDLTMVRARPVTVTHANYTPPTQHKTARGHGLPHRILPVRQGPLHHPQRSEQPSRAGRWKDERKGCSGLQG